MPSSGSAARSARRLERAPRSARRPDTGLTELAGYCICGNLRMASRLVSAYYDAALRPAGIEANQMIMLWIAHTSTRMPAREVAYVAGMDQSTASRNLAVLKERGLVTLASSSEDRRERLVSLTPRGRATLHRAFPRWQKAQAELSERMADLVDLAAAGRTLRKVSRRLQGRATG